LPDATGSGVGP
ncbi:hypothetical protein E2320_006675, partial [Naja naja]